MLRKMKKQKKYNKTKPHWTHLSKQRDISPHFYPSLVFHDIGPLMTITKKKKNLDTEKNRKQKK